MPVGNVRPTPTQAVADKEEEWAAQTRPGQPAKVRGFSPIHRFLLAANPTGHRTVRVVVAVVGRLL